MSIMQNDREKLKRRKRTPDKGQEQGFESYFKAALRDSTIKQLMDQCEEEDVGKKILEAWAMHKSHVEAHQERMETLQQWDEYLDDYELDYDGTSNIHLPLPLIVVKTFHARMYQALTAIDPPFSVRAMQEAYADDVDMVYGLMSWTLKEWCNYNEGMEAVIDRWLWNWVSKGSGILKLRWDCKYTRYLDVVDTYIRGASQWNVVINEQTGMVEQVEQPQIIKSQKEVAVTEKIFEGPVFEYVANEDCAIIGGREVQTADMIIHRSRYTKSQLESEALRGVFSQKVVDEIIDGGPHSESGRLGTNIKQDREIHDGIQTLDVGEDLDTYEVLEAYVEVDINNDGINESVIVWIDGQQGRILRATYTHRVLRGGKRPFANIEFIPREGHAYAMGLLELIHPISVEIDMIHNIKVDIGMMAAMPIGFYRAATGLDPVKLKLKPGDLIPVDEPANHVNFPNLGQRDGFFKDEEALLMQHIERLTSINDINTATLGRQGAARTATGVSQLVAENSANLDIFIKRMQRGWRQALRILWQMLQQRLPDGTEFRVTGRDGKEYFQRLNRNMIQQRVDFYLESTSANSNRMIQLEQSMQVLAQMMNPMFLQVGIVTPNGQYEALKDYFQALGKKDYARFISRPKVQPRQLTAEEELARLVNGKTVPVTPEADHEGFVKIAEDFLDQDGVDKVYGREAIQKIEAQVQQHQAMQKAMEAQANQIAQANQQMINGMGAGGAAAPGMPPMNFGNPYNDFQMARSDVAQRAGGPVPGMPGAGEGEE